LNRLGGKSGNWFLTFSQKIVFVFPLLLLPHYNWSQA
jgi:hypothetical protein